MKPDGSEKCFHACRRELTRVKLPLSPKRQLNAVIPVHVSRLQNSLELSLLGGVRLLTDWAFAGTAVQAFKLAQEDLALE